MRGFVQLTLTELKLFLREPQAAFFTLVFPVMFLVLFASIYGNEAQAGFGGLGFVDVMVPSYTAMIITSSAIISLGVGLATYRERGILRRLLVTPLRPHAILAAQTLTLFVVTVAGMALLVLVGKLAYGLRFPGDAAAVAGAFVLSCLGLFAVGFVVAGPVPTARTAQIVGMVLLYPMIFLSGATIPREVLPERVQQVAQILPTTHAVTLLRATWGGHALSQHPAEVAFLAGLVVLAALVSAKTFRWD